MDNEVRVKFNDCYVFLGYWVILEGRLLYFFVINVLRMGKSLWIFFKFFNYFY